MPCDFVDDDGAVLTADKMKQLDDRQLFYCSICREVISMEDDAENAKFVALKCEHVSCRECARKSTRRELEEIEHIPSCPVCPQKLTEDDLIAIWGKKRALQLMDQLFKSKSLKVPPFRPQLAAGSVPGTLPEPQPEALRPNAVEIAAVVPIENEPDIPMQNEPDIPMENEPENAMESKEDEEWGHCLTPECHQKHRLKGSRLDCTGCGISWCTRCGVEWHFGENCDEYQTAVAVAAVAAAEEQYGNGGVFGNAALAMEQQYGSELYADGLFRNAQDEQFEAEYAKRDWRTCRRCHSVVEKAGGCNHMTCHCGFHFCWLCEQEVDPLHLDKHYEIGVCALNEGDESAVVGV